ncbi:hypothetical protein MOQ72_13255 [Saccharopolyspora sp. K220]|uniref:hypothetical protein n=1 Tax=Saccharopolyspora soli TaxID=2926618 RepID=UPI001F57D2CE|nr:hypothetical protein [Saccharopolyspora soli]MCI2418399.1 hypothetical protein [Saccharopolyspora soli]
MTKPSADQRGFLDEPPEFHEKLLDYGERPYWSPDGRRIAFIDKNFGDVCELDLASRQVRNLTKDNGAHHSFLRVLFLPNGDYLLIGPRHFEDRERSRFGSSELWFMDRDAAEPPRPLGPTIFEGCGVSTRTPTVTYSVYGRIDPSTGAPEDFEIRVADLDYSGDQPELVDRKVVYTTRNGRCPEPQDFRHNDTEVIFAEYVNRFPRRNTLDWKTVVKGVEVDTGVVRTYIDEHLTHNEPEGIFPDGEHICLESSCDFENYWPPIDLWKLKLDGSGRRVRMTRAIDHPPWRCSNSNVSPDGRWLAFMVNTRGDMSGFGRGLGLLDLEKWGRSEAAEQWEAPAAYRSIPISS